MQQTFQIGMMEVIILVGVVALVVGTIVMITRKR